MESCARYGTGKSEDIQDIGQGNARNVYVSNERGAREVYCAKLGTNEHFLFQLI